MSYENITTLQNVRFIHFVANNYNITLKNITIKNVNGVPSQSNDLIFYENMPFSINVIDGLYVSDLYLAGRSIIKINTPLDVFQVRNSVFESINTTTSDSLIDTGIFKALLFTNISISNINLADQINKGGVVLKLSNMDLNSQFDTIIQDISINNCEASFIDFTSFFNTPPSPKLISIANLNYTNGHFIDDRAFMSTDGVELDVDLTITMSNLIFSNVSFEFGGTIVELKHQMNNHVTITDSEFSNMNAALISVMSSNTQRTDLLTMVQINDTTFDNINNGFNSLVNVNEGGRLDVNN